MKVIDIDSWVRKDNYHFYRGIDNPLFQICANVVITHLFPLIKQNKLSFYQVMIYFVMEAVNSVKELKTRIQGDQVVEYSMVHGAPVIQGYDEQVRYCMLEHKGCLREVLEAAEPVILREKR